MPQVEVLLTNGVRAKVSIQPNSRLQAVMDVLAEKYGVDAHRSKLMKNKQSIDLSMVFRYSGLVNNCKLELRDVIPSDEEDSSAAMDDGTNGEITVILQVASDRFSDKFSTSLSLFDMLQQFDVKHHRFLQTVSTSDHYGISYLGESLVGEDKLKKLMASDVFGTSKKVLVRFVTVPKVSEMSPPAKKPHISSTDAPMEVVQATNGTSSAVNPFSVFQDKSESMFQGNPNDKASTSSRPQPPAREPSVLIPNFPALLSETSEAGPPQPQFNEFKFPQETEGKNLYDNEMLPIGAVNLQSHGIPSNRDGVLFVEVTSPMTDLDDDFFELTENDIRVIHTDLRRQAQPFQKAGSSAHAASPTLAVSIVKFKLMFVKRPAGLLALQAIFHPDECVTVLFDTVLPLAGVTDTNALHMVAPILDGRRRRIPRSSKVTLRQLGLVPNATVDVHVDSVGSFGRLIDESSVVAMSKWPLSTKQQAREIATKYRTT